MMREVVSLVYYLPSRVWPYYYDNMKSTTTVSSKSTKSLFSPFLSVFS